jgi:hypothetical protein
MTPKEKAEKLVKRYYRDSDLLVEDLTWIQAKECALICVDEIRNNLPLISEIQDFWTEVKIEIISL